MYSQVGRKINRERSNYTRVYSTKDLSFMEQVVERHKHATPLVKTFNILVRALPSIIPSLKLCRKPAPKVVIVPFSG